jgi:signal transduction histidine kinase/DNA-binding response OmpR family regulator
MPVTPGTILIIDDTPSSLEVASDCLAETGFDILVAQDGVSGLEIAQQMTPDLILLDVMMPGIDGLETCRRLKADSRTAAIPVIFMTALADTDHKLKGFRAGAVDYITKPVQVEELLARVETHLMLWHIQQRLEEQNTELQTQMKERCAAEEKLQQAHDELEHRVIARTAELGRTNAQLKAEIDERKLAEAEIKRRNLELALLNRVIADSATETKTEAILETACRELALVFNLPLSAAFLLNADRVQATIVAEYLAPSSGQNAKDPSILNVVVPVAGNPLAQNLIKDRQSLLFNDCQNEPRLESLRAITRRRSARSLLLTPLVSMDEVVGCIFLAAYEPDRFTDEQMRLARSVADQVSGVMTRIRLDEERRQLEEQYHQAQKMEAIGKLTGGVAHDFNNILTVIMGVTDLMSVQQGSGSPLRARLKQVQDATLRAADLVRQLLAFSRQQVLQPQVLNLNKVIANFEKMLHRVIGEDIALRTRFEPQLGRIKADPGQIEQVLMNLVVNARDAMPSGGSLTIETADVYIDADYARRHVGVAPGPYVRLVVSDNGMGMDADTQARIFEPFFTTKAKGEGTGLGLSTVHGIVNQSGGHIWVYSEQGHGTSFKIYLPHVEESSEYQTQASLPGMNAPSGSETVLVVEDDDIVRELVLETLKMFGYIVLAADCGAQAQQMYTDHEGPIHLLLTDVIMPGGQSGAQLAKALTANNPQMAVLFMSGYTDDTIVHHGVLEPGIAFIQKPFVPNDLAAKVREVLDKAQSS